VSAVNARGLRCFAFALLNVASGASVALAGSNAAAAEDEDGETKSDDAEEHEDGAKKEEHEDGAKKEEHEDGAGKDAETSESTGHGGQFGLRVGMVGGLRMVVRYEKSVYCKEPEDLASLQNEQKFCGHVAPFALDLGLSFGVSNAIEPFVWGRLGLSGEEQTDTNPLVLVGAGLRLYSMSDSAIKILIEPAIALEFEDGQGHVPWSLVPDGYDTDFVLHLAAGPQFDFSRNVGLYVSGGLTAGVIRALHASLDLQIGLQGRYP
jgi:hypothetical protein